MENHVDDDHRMFYFQHDGYWNGTLIRVRMKNETNNETDNIFCYEMKIYNRYDIFGIKIIHKSDFFIIFDCQASPKSQ